MALYVLLQNSDDSILEEVDGDKRFRSGTPPTLRPEKGMRWLPITITNPAHDGTTQVKEGPVLTINADNVTRVWTVRDKTAQELDEIENDRTLHKLNLLKPLIKALNDGSFVPGSNHTNAQLKAIIKSHL
jgi:hypothetical protein